MGLVNSLNYIMSHPFNRDARAKAAMRYFRWQAGSKLLGFPAIVPFVGDANLAVSKGMTGATGNIYCGLHEFASMGFVLHMLRPGNLFADIGANVGTYTILAAETGADCVAFEPIPATLKALQINLRLNDFGDRVKIVRSCVGRSAGTVQMTLGMGPMNHVAVPGADGGTIEVSMVTLDSSLSRAPTVIKIDVEGFESDVLEGGEKWFSDPALLGVTMETGVAPERYGSHSTLIHDKMLGFGFLTVDYDPLSRKLTKTSGIETSQNNTLYVRDFDMAQRLLETAPYYGVQGRNI